MEKDYEVFELGDVSLVSGATLYGAKLAYKTQGKLNANRDNAILFPTCYAGTHAGQEYMIGVGQALDPTEYCIIQVNMFANGLSSSPSNTNAPQDRGRFPNVTVLDNVQMQYRLVTERFGIDRLALVCGFSMGAQQAFQWAAAYPEMVERVAPWCGTATTTPHNYVFLEGVKAAICADVNWNNGDYEEPPVSGLRTLGRFWAGWGLSQEFYYQKLYLDLGYRSLEDFLLREWEESFLSQDANNLLAMAWTWQHADIGMTPGCEGDRKKALRRITAKAMIMPSQTDLYFPPQDIIRDAELIAGADYRVIPSLYGHGSGGNRNASDFRFVNDGIQELLNRRSACDREKGGHSGSF